MAEGGQNPDEDNPFSFKSFVSKTYKNESKDEQESVVDELDIFDMPETSTERKRDKHKQIIVVEREGSKQKQKKGKSENPFSFKKFLSSSSGKSSERQSASQPHSHQRLSDDSESTSHDVPTLHVAGDLPDFVQDHYTDNIGSPRGSDLPDFTFRGITKNGPDIGDANFSNTDYTHSVSDDNLEHRLSYHQSNVGDISDGEDGAPPQSGLVHSLPDFLSDAAVSSSKNSDSVSSNPVISRESRFPNVESNSHLELEMLQTQIEELKSKRAQDAERISELQCQMVEQKNKEIEETAAMEHAMEQVEEHLSATTRRADHAETMVTKLKQEVKTLQTEVKALRGDNGMLSSDQHLTDVKERTSYVAEQLSTATKSAESSLRQLLSGVDNLKLLSQVLTSIDKIMEDKSSTDHKQSDDNS